MSTSIPRVNIQKRALKQPYALRNHCSIPQWPQTSSVTATGHRDTCPMQTGIISLFSKDDLDFFCLLHFREKIKGMGCLESLVMMTSSVFCPQCWIYTGRMKTTHLFLAAPYLPVWHFHWPELSAHTSLTFGAAQAAAGSLHLPPCFIHIYCTRTNAFYKKML